MRLFSIVKRAGLRSQVLIVAALGRFIGWPLSYRER